MSSIREVEVNLPAAGTFQAGCVDPSTWTASTLSTTEYPCSMLEPGSSIRIAPMVREFGGWNEAHFHPSLKLPLGCNAGTGVLVMLEAKARECVAVALSPIPGFELGKTYVVHFGAFGNVSTVLRRRDLSGNEVVDVQIASRVCADYSWIRYWLCLVGGQFFVGIGNIPGEQCIGMMDDSLYNQLQSGVNAVRFVGLGNSALGKSPRSLKIRRVVVTTVPDELCSVLTRLDTNNLPMVAVDRDTADEDMKVMMDTYQKECEKAKARAKKFGIPYKEPKPDAFLSWSNVKRLRSNPESGFVTGIDLMSAEEQERKRVRAERFGTDTPKRPRDADADADDERDNRIAASVSRTIFMSEAWDNEELVRPYRVDPPKELWATPLLEDSQEDDVGVMVDSDPAILIEGRIHVFSLDWSAFKQIRTDDLMAYFSVFGPTYVEWLGEVSCNVHFADKFSAARALHGLSQAISYPPPDEVSVRYDNSLPPDFGKMGWCLCQQPLRKVSNDKFGRRGTTARILMRVATSVDILIEKPSSIPAPPPGFSAKRVLGPGSDFDTGHRQKRQKGEATHEERGEVNTYFEGEHPLLSQGLRSGRDGYSLEDLEAERRQNEDVEVVLLDHE